jgi:hypothetical protein
MRWRAAELSDRVDDVAAQVVHVVAPPPRGFDVVVDGADVSPRVVDVSELADCLCSRLVGREAGCDERVDPHVEVERQFVVDVGADLLPRSPRQVEEASHRLRPARAP